MRVIDLFISFPSLLVKISYLFLMHSYGAVISVVCEGVGWVAVNFRLAIAKVHEICSILLMHLTCLIKGLYENLSQRNRTGEFLYACEKDSDQSKAGLSP